MAFIAVVPNPPQMDVPETWLECTGVHLTHIVNGYGADVFKRAKQEIARLESDDELRGFLDSVVVLNDCPPEWVGTEWQAVWESRSWQTISASVVAGLNDLAGMD